jgi:hypothetical protein
MVMKRHVVTFSVELYARPGTPIEETAEYVRSDIEERLAITGEQGNGYTAKVVNIGEALSIEEES